jgi:hypothetical protein
VSKYIPKQTLKFKLACNNRSDLRVSIGIASDKNATEPEHVIAPQVLNGWPLFGGRNNVEKVPLAGPNDNTPLELGIDLTPLIEKLGPDAANKGRLFLHISCAEKGKTSGTLHACTIRSYDDQGRFSSESAIKIKNGDFSKSPLILDAMIK